MKCKHIKDDGTECQTETLRNGELCFFHAPEKEEERKEASSAGEKVSYYDKGLVKAEPIDITENKTAIIYILTDTINRVRRLRNDGSMDIRVANCIGFLSSKILEAQKELLLADRLDALEEKLKESGVFKLILKLDSIKY